MEQRKKHPKSASLCTRVCTHLRAGRHCPTLPCGQIGECAAFLVRGLLRFLLWSLDVRSMTQCHLLFMPSITQCFAARQTQKTAKGARPVQRREGGRRAAQRGSALSPRPHFHLSPHVLRPTQNTQLSEALGWERGCTTPTGVHALGTQP